MSHKSSPFAFEIRERIFRDKKLIFDSKFYSPNTMTHEGQADMLNVWARETPVLDKYIMLLNMPDTAAPTRESVYADLTESTTPGTNGYDRQQLLSSDWDAPALSGTEMRIQSAEKSFGPFTDSVPVSHVGLVSTATGSGKFFLYISTLYHNSNNTSRIYAPGEIYLVTIRDKQN